LISAVTCFTVNADETAEKTSAHTIRIGLNYASAAQAEISIDTDEGGFIVHTSSEEPVSIDVNTLSATVNGDMLRINTIFGAEIAVAELNQKITILPMNVASKISYNNSEYYGYFELYANNNGKIVLINVTDLEDYLRGVLPSEIYPSWHMDALKAAAVVSRTFALKSASNSSHSSSGFDICATTHCQMYSGTKKENERTNQAIDETESLILIYRLHQYYKI
jgi:peptidoglycan hydrolase-like amidase